MAPTEPMRPAQGNRPTCLDQFLCMAFAQLTFRESLRDIEACLRAHQDKLYHMGIRDVPKHAGQCGRDWRIYAEFARHDSHCPSPICTRTWDWSWTTPSTPSRPPSVPFVFPWALFRSTKSAVDTVGPAGQHSDIYSRLRREDADVNVLDILVPEPGAFYIMDRGYVDFERLFLLHTVGAFFIIRAKSNTRYERRYSHPVDKTTGVVAATRRWC